MYNKELWRVRKGLDKVEHARNEEADRLSSPHEEVRNVQERILAVETKEKAKGNALKRNAVYVRGLKNNMELWHAWEGLDEVEHARNKEADRLSSLHEEACDVQERILTMEAKEKAKGNALNRGGNSKKH